MARPVQLVSQKEAAAICGVSLRHFQSVVDRSLPRIYFGSSVRYDVRDVDALLERWKVKMQRPNATSR